MNTNLEKDLTARFPLILRDMGGDLRKTCMAWGMECGDGWHPLIESAMEKIQFVCDLSSQTTRPVQLIATQIKEKFGTLRFYYSVEGDSPLATAVLDDIVSSAEASSSQVCETSGTPGNLCIRGHWYKTLSRPTARAEGYKACDEGTEEYWSELDAETAGQSKAPPPPGNSLPI